MRGLLRSWGDVSSNKEKIGIAIDDLGAAGIKDFLSVAGWVTAYIGKSEERLQCWHASCVCDRRSADTGALLAGGHRLLGSRANGDHIGVKNCVFTEGRHAFTVDADCIKRIGQTFKSADPCSNHDAKSARATRTFQSGILHELFSLVLMLDS